jgi:hypothetical protein
MGLLFGLAYSQSPLYTSNQNQYFLHGFARASIGFLEHDWLANTVDPTPVFTALVQFTIMHLGEALFYLYALTLLGIYSLSLYQIAVQAINFNPNREQRALLVGALILIHSAALRLVLSRTLGGEWEYLLDGGVAGQRLLGPVLQPSMFGALLLLSIQSFLSGHRLRALVLSSMAASIHATYLLGAALITLSYLYLIWREQRSLRQVIVYGLLALGLVAPAIGYLLSSFIPPSGAAQQILVEFRLPAHTDPNLWIDITTLVKLGLVGLALAAARKTSLFPILLFSLVIGLGLSLLQFVLDSPGLALLFPWRVSTYLVPLASAILLATLIQRLVKTIPVWTSYVGIVSLAALGMISFGLKLQEQRELASKPVLEHVQATAGDGDLFLIPPKMQDFRLDSLAPAFADFKSIPYRSDEVLEWHQRNRMLDWFYRDTLADIDCDLVARFRDEYGVTHVLLGPLQMGLECANLTALYDDGSYALMKILPEG